MRRIAKISEELEGHMRLDKIDKESCNVWINECIAKSIITDDTIYDAVEFKGDAANMDLDKDYDCKIDFQYREMTVLEAIAELKKDVHNYLVDSGDDEDFAEILLDEIILN